MTALRVALALSLAVLALALVGEYRYDPAAFRAEPLEQLYRGIQVFTMEMDWATRRPLPWELELARFLAPMVTFVSLVLVFVRGAWLGIVHALLRFRRDHVVVVGLNGLGLHFARSCRAAGLQAVAIERNDANPNVETCRREGTPVVVGDALDERILRRAGVGWASDLVTFVDDDGVNVELTLRAKSLTRALAGDRPPLRVRCHLGNVALSDRLEEYPKFFLDPHLAEISFFNVHTLAARTLLREHPPEVYADALRCGEVHVAVLGATALAEQIVLQVARTAHFANGALPRISLCAEDSEATRARLAQLHPGVDGAAQLDFVSMRLTPDALAGGRSPLPIVAATAYVICLDDESAALSLALGVRRATLLGRGLNAPVMVAMAKSDGLARLLESKLGVPEIPDGLYPFGMLDETVSAATIIDERLDRLAQAIHEDYLEGVARRGGLTGKPSHQSWSSLREVYRRANRLSADHLDAKLRAVGCRESMPVAGEPALAFSADEIERLARMERSRFVAVRRSTGWTSGAVRSDFARIETNLDPWEKLDADRRGYDLRGAEDIPQLLARRIGRRVRREVVIGVTGHRLHRLPTESAGLVAAIERTLRHVAGLHPDAEFTILSSLAEGADRMVARAGLDVLGARLHVPLPLPYELYVEDFGAMPSLARHASTEEFHALLGRAERYVEMPLEFGTVATLSHDHPDSRAARARQYALAGAFVVQRSHELVAVWDGAVEEGEGGTAQVVAWRQRGVPDAYRFPDAFFPPVPMTAPFVIPPDAGSEFAPSRVQAE
jgi:hypothetical protein